MTNIDHESGRKCCPHKVVHVQHVEETSPPVRRGWFRQYDLRVTLGIHSVYFVGTIRHQP